MKRFALLLILLLCSPAWAKTIHSMAADMTGGNGDGTTKANAMDFATAKTAAALDPGDTIVLYDDMGDFPAITFTAVADEEGTAGAHITIQRFDGTEVPTFAGPVFFNNYTVDQYIDWTGVVFNAGTGTYAARLYGGGNMTFTDCQFYGPKNTWTSVYGPCLSYRAAGLGYGLQLETPSPTTILNDITLTRCTFQAYRGLLANFYPRNLTITDCIFQNGAADLASINGFDGLTITGCQFGDANYRRYAQWNDVNQDGDVDPHTSGTATGAFTVGNYVRQAVSNAVGRVDYFRWTTYGGTLSAAFTAGNYARQAVTNAVGIVDSSTASIVVFRQTSAANFTDAQDITEYDSTNTTPTGKTLTGAFTIDPTILFNQMTAVDFVENQTISEYDSTNTTATGNTLSGTFKVDFAGHPDSLQINPLPTPIISAIEEDQPSAGRTRITFSSWVYNYCQTGETVYITGLTGAQAGGINDQEWVITREDDTKISIGYDWPALAEITVPAGTALAMPLMRNLTISRNTFNTTAYQYSAIDLILKKASNTTCDGITVESNLVKGNYAVGAWFDGINTRLHDNFVVNNNTFMNTAATSGIRLGFTTMATYGGGVVSKMYNNLSVGILITGNTGDGTWVVTAHNNNSFGTADNITQDPSDIWTPGANDLHSVDFTGTTYFTDYAGGVYTLKPNSPAARTGSALGGVATDLNGNAISDPPDRGCYRFDKGKLVIIRN